MKRAFVALAAVTALLLAGCTGTDAEPEAPGGVAEVAPAPVLPADELDDYSGVARVQFVSNCTATLVETGVDTAPAYVITNGHCVGLDGGAANATVVDEEGFGFARFFDVAGADNVLEVEAARFEYGTMRGTDLGIVRLDATLGELRSQGVLPLPLASAPPEPGLEVVNISAPVEGLEEKEWVLRKGACTVGETVDVLEFVWLWLGSAANDCAGLIGGASGSPLIADGQIAGVINTTTQGFAAERGDTCYLGRPCEVRGADAVFVPDAGYSVDIAGVSECFVAGEFTLGGACPLQVTTLTDRPGLAVFGANGTDANGSTPEVQLFSSVAADAQVVWDLPLNEARSCADAATYAEGATVAVPADSEEPASLPITLPTENGFVLACAAVPGEEAQAARMVFVVDAIAPTAGPQFFVQDLDTEMVVDPLFDLPDVSSIEVKHGPLDTTDCSDTSGYEPYWRQAFYVSKDDLPTRFCAIGHDLAGNASPPSELLLPADGR